MTMMSASYSNSGTEIMNGHLCVGDLTRGNYLSSEGYFKAPEGLIRAVMFFRNDNGMLPNLTTVEINQQFLRVAAAISHTPKDSPPRTPPPPPTHGWEQSVSS